LLSLNERFESEPITVLNEKERHKNTGAVIAWIEVNFPKNSVFDNFVIKNTTNHCEKAKIAFPKKVQERFFKFTYL
jgi:hypothetical protein